MWTIRRMVEADVPATASLEADCYRFLARRQGFSRRQLQALLSERCSEVCVRHFFLAFDHYVVESAGEWVGMVDIEGNEIAELWVTPDHHREGVGTALYTCAEGTMRRAGHQVLTVHTTGYAVPFYLAMGARVTGSRPCGDGPLRGWVLTNLEKDLVDS